MAIYRDLLGNKGYLNELLSDTEGKSLRRHRFRTFFSRRYVNDEEEEFMTLACSEEEKEEEEDVPPALLPSHRKKRTYSRTRSVDSLQR